MERPLKLGTKLPSDQEISLLAIDSERLNVLLLNLCGGEVVSLSYSSAILGPPPTPGIYSEKITMVKGTRTPVFTAALFTTARTWKQPRCASADGWKRKLSGIF